MLHILPPAAWQEFRDFPKGKTLNETAIHFAIVKGPDGKERKCAVKFIDLNSRPGLICEGLGWIFAQEAGVNVPSFAAILRVPLTKLSTCMPLPSFLQGFQEYPAWCVEIVEGKALSQVHRWLFWLARANCLGAKNTPVIASFDHWADNQDRNYGNVIKSASGQYVAIDHEALLHEVLYAPYGMKFGLNSLLVEAENRLSTEKYLRFKCEMAVAAQKHKAAMNGARAAGRALLEKIIPDPSMSAKMWTDIEAFLDVRATLGWMSNELGVTI